MQARIKVQSLPPAPKPTKASKAVDPREKERQLRIKEHRELHLRIDEGKTLCFWDKARVSKLQRLYNEGHTLKYIARECGCEKDICRNRLDYEFKRGALQRRSRAATKDQVETILQRYTNGESMNMISKELRMSRNAVRKVLEENNVEIRK